MSGHSKWHNIQAKKGKADAARGKVFTKLFRKQVSVLHALLVGSAFPARFLNFLFFPNNYIIY